MNTANRALVVLAAYDYESLAVTLQSLEHTVSNTEKIVVVLNGKRFNTASEKTERVARTWAAKNPVYRFAVRPLSAGKSAFRALTEIFSEYEPLQNVQQICKIDDDLIPLKKGWLDTLANTYNSLAKDRNMGFVTGLINNNCWGFDELVKLFDKQEEFNHIFNYTSVAGIHEERKVPAKTIDTGMYGTVWSYPYTAWWIHQWTSLQTDLFIAKTNELPFKQISADTYYSIGSVYFEKDFWLSMDPKKYRSIVDELLMHEYCKALGKEKWAVMSEPMIHLFYRTQRQVNAPLFQQLLPELARHFNDRLFTTIQPMNHEDMQLIEDVLDFIKGRTDYAYNKLSLFSFGRRWKEKAKQKQYMH